jgi:hypothetical protein
LSDKELQGFLDLAMARKENDHESEVYAAKALRWNPQKQRDALYSALYELSQRREIDKGKIEEVAT